MLHFAPRMPPMDVTATISRLFVYPVKSCAGVALDQVTLTETGLEFDRAWMVVDAQGQFVTQRALPRMALIQPQLKTFEMVLRAPGMLALHIALEKVEQAVQVTVWDDRVAAFDMGDVAAQWFSDFLQQPVRLVRFDPAQRRLSSPKWTGADEGLNQFSDGFAVLVISEASLDGLNARLAAAGEAAVGMERFRPNIVLAGIDAHDEDRLDALHITTAQGEAVLRMVKPCPRCPIPNIDPATATSTPVVGDMLQTYRQTAVVGGAVAFGMNAIVRAGVDAALRVGQAATADYRFD
jgi:uncharacterized protein YcbX